MRKDKKNVNDTERDGDVGKKKRTWLGIVLIALEVIVIIVLAIILIKQKNNNQQLQQEQNEQAQEQYNNHQNEVVKIQLYNYLYINEVSEDGNVEIYNASAYDSDIAEECVLYVNGEKAVTYTGNIKSKGVLLGSTGFAFKEGDNLALYYGDNLADQMMLPEMQVSASYGRNAEDLNVFAYIAPTLGKGNDGAEIFLLDQPYASAPSGFYDDAFQLYIFAKEGQNVYYTLDGTEPTLESKPYTNPITITNVSGNKNVYSAIAETSVIDGIPSTDVDKCVVLRFAVIDEEGKKGPEKTDNYFVGYATKAAYKDIPTLVLITNPENMFDYFSGNYLLGEAYEDAMARTGNTGVNDADYYKGWVAYGVYEYYENNKTISGKGNMSFTVVRDDAVEYSQKSLKVTIGDSKGLGCSSVSEYLHQGSNTFILDASGYDNTYKLRDLLVNELASETSVLMKNIKPVAVFIDGEYWGIYCMQDYYDKEYISAMTGIDVKNIALADTDEQNKTDEKDIDLFSELYDFVTRHDLTVPNNYNKVLKMMDIQSYIDCYCTHIYIGDSAYPEANDYVWRSYVTGSAELEDAKWRWAFGNADVSMKISKLTNFSLNTYLRPQIDGDLFLRSLMRNQDFNKQFVETMNRMATEYFAPEVVDTWLTETTGALSKAIVRSALRFGITITDTSVSNAADVIRDFFNNRAEYMQAYTEKFSKESLQRKFTPPVEKEE